MNLLAHALLAHAFLPDSGGMETCGAIMADYFSGEKLSDYPEAVGRGIVHHRRIDAFTDSHPEFALSRALLASEAPPHSSGILVDLFWDNILGSRWEEFGKPLCGTDLSAFSRSAYERLGRSRAFRSPMFSRVAPWIISMDWLGAYASEKGIDRALRGLASRLPHGGPLAGCARLMGIHRAALEERFRAFWPELVEFAACAAVR
jgi:acyl carrier protein phosphodiesterase